MGGRNLISESTCYKNPEKPSSTDLILRYSSLSFQNPCAIESGLTDFHKMTITVMKTTFQKLNPKLIYYRFITVYFPTINLAKNSGPNYLWKTLVTQATIWKNFNRFALVF